MARLSKSSFAAQDKRRHNHDDLSEESLVEEPQDDDHDSQLSANDEDSIIIRRSRRHLGLEQTILDTSDIGRDEQTERDMRRDPPFTGTPTSRRLDSLYPTDSDCAIPLYQPYRSPSARIAMKNSESIPRAYTGSPMPRPRVKQNWHRRIRSCAGTPTNLGKALASRRQPEEEQDDMAYPLVLLHINLLPVKLPWADESVEQLLPPPVLHRYRSLRSKVTSGIQQRGILIQHPREEFDLLEERLLEALELRPERLTADGHFNCSRSSFGSSSDSEASKAVHGGSNDSGLGSSDDGSDNDTCSLCQHKLGYGSRPKEAGKWSIKVLAANGLIKSSAWAACWSEMERVDVEILPHIPDEVKEMLDDAKRQIIPKGDTDREVERIRALIVEQLQLERASSTNTVDDLTHEDLPSACVSTEQHSPMPDEYWAASNSNAGSPRVYKRSQIPLALLLKNYVYILAQDRKNVAIFVLALLASLLAFQPTGPRMKSGVFQNELTDVVPDLAIASSAVSATELVTQTAGLSDSRLTFDELNHASIQRIPNKPLPDEFTKNWVTVSAPLPTSSRSSRNEYLFPSAWPSCPTSFEEA